MIMEESLQKCHTKRFLKNVQKNKQKVNTLIDQKVKTL